jgi:hypothetical protein
MDRLSVFNRLIRPSVCPLRSRPPRHVSYRDREPLHCVGARRLPIAVAGLGDSAVIHASQSGINLGALHAALAEGSAEAKLMMVVNREANTRCATTVFAVYRMVAIA